MTDSYLDPVETANIWAGHLRQAEADRLNATLRAARARADGNDAQAEVEEKTVAGATKAISDITAKIPADIAEIMEAIRAEQAKAAELQRKQAARQIAESSSSSAPSASSED